MPTPSRLVLHTYTLNVREKHQCHLKTFLRTFSSHLPRQQLCWIVQCAVVGFKNKMTNIFAEFAILDDVFKIKKKTKRGRSVKGTVNLIHFTLVFCFVNRASETGSQPPHWCGLPDLLMLIVESLCKGGILHKAERMYRTNLRTAHFLVKVLLPYNVGAH